MRRREFIALFGGTTIAWPLAVQAQRLAVPVIGFLRAGQPPKTWVEAFQQGLQERGYTVGQNVIVEFRFTDGGLDQLPRLAEELLLLKVHLIVASGTSAAIAARKATTAVPIVFASVTHPVEIGLVASLARPGGNITGMAFNSADFAGKRLELLRGCVPALKRVAALSYPALPTDQVQLEGATKAARALGMQIESVPIAGPDDFTSAFKAVRNADGLLCLDSPFFTTYRTRIAESVAASRLPAIYGYREMVVAGGLMSYGPQIADFHRLAATHVDKILKGANPAELPVEQPTKFELVINSRAAKALSVTIPPLLLAQTDDVIE